MKFLTYRIFQFALGILLVGAGVAFIVKSGLGSDPITTLMQGISLTFRVSFGRAAQILMGAALIAVLFLDRKRIGVGTFVHSVALGLVIDLCLKMDLSGFSGLFAMCNFLLLGIFLLGLGMSLYILSDFGEGSVDAIMMYGVKKTGLDVKYIRIGMDVLMGLSGFLLGGTVGVGTVAAMLLIGPSVQLCMKLPLPRRGRA